MNRNILNLNLRCVLEDTLTSSSVIGRRSNSHTQNIPDITNLDTYPSTRNIVSSKSTVENAKFILSMFMYMDGTDIASVSEHVPARAVTNSSNLSVSGSIPGVNGEKGLLEVNITYPREDQAGNYSCLVTAIDDIGHTIVYSTSVAIDITSPTINDLVHIVQNMRQEDIRNKGEITRLQQEEAVKQAAITALQKDNLMNKATIAKLQQDSTQCKDEIIKLHQEDTRQQAEITKLQQDSTQCCAKVASVETTLTEKTHIEGSSIRFGNLGVPGHAPHSRTQHVSFSRAYR